jgi:TRAP transporter TAXI family solute receptor
MKHSYVAVAGIALMGCAGALGGTASAKEAIVFGTSSIGSTFYVLSVGMSEMINKHANISTTVQPVGGSIPNLFAIATKKTDLAMASSLAMQDRYFGRKPFRKPYEIRLIAQGQPNFRVILVRKGSGVKTPKDLIGRTMIGKRRAIPDMAMITSALFKVHNIPPSKVRVIDTVNTGQVVKALRAGTVDAAVYPAALKQPALTSLMQDGIVDFLYLTKESRDAMLKMLPDAFYQGEFKPGFFPGQKQGLNNFGLYTGLVARADMKEEMVYNIIKSIVGRPKEFSKYHAAARQWTVANSLKHPAVPFHDGAIRYYKEVGAWTPAMDAQQKKLLARK